MSAKIFEGEQHHDARLWTAIGEMGWLGTAVDEQFGGVGMSYLELCVIAEELGRHMAPVPFSSSAYLAIEGIKLAGSDEQKNRWLPKLASGESIGALAVAEGVGPVDGFETVCFKDSALNGTKWPVLDGESADLLLVLAKEDAGQSLFVVETKAQGLTRTCLDSLDPSRSQSRIDFVDVSAERLGYRGRWFDVRATFGQSRGAVCI